MIQTARQLKDLIRNMAKGDSGKAQLLIRNYAMERFLERVTLSAYKDNFILKGGMLVSSLVGLDNRATMDIDTELHNLPLHVESAKAAVESIIAVPLNDNIRFEIKDVVEIMEEMEYGGVRLSLEAFLDRTRIPLKIDISTGDAITPAQVRYQYKLMFEERCISLWSYNLETLLAEKIETVLSRAAFNTRMRDYYDLYALQKTGMPIQADTLAAALRATCSRRGSGRVLQAYAHILNEVYRSGAMQGFWQNYQEKNSYAAGVSWNDVMSAVRILCDSCIEGESKNSC